MSTDDRTLPVDEHIRKALSQNQRTFHSRVEHGEDSVRLGDDVTHSTLNSFTDIALAGRLNYYEREHAFERSAGLRADFKREITRTLAEIARRAQEKRADAVMVALTSPAGRADIEAANDAEANWQRITKVAA